MLNISLILAIAKSKLDFTGTETAPSRHLPLGPGAMRFDGGLLGPYLITFYLKISCCNYFFLNL